MAIWPFNRKSKRHTIQVTGAEAADLQSSFAEPTIEPTLGRKPSKRQSNRTSRADAADSRRSSALVPSNRPVSSLDRPASIADHPRNPPSRDPPLTRTGSLLRRKPSQNGNPPNKLRRKLSKRKANEIMREREIRMLSSTPIDIPRRPNAGSGDYVLEHRRKANGRRADRYMSDISLSIRDSATSSTSDISDPYTYKVNAFAALTPRPVVRYVEAPRLQTARSSNPPASSRQDKERLQALTMSEDDFYYSKRRVNELADSLDAGALRELLDRDRRRREKKQVDDQERLRRKLQERADAQQAQEQKVQVATEPEPAPAPEPETEIAQPEPSIAEVAEPEDVPNEETTVPQVDEPTAIAPENESWLLGTSKGSENLGRESRESSRIVGNIDDSSIRERRLVQRPSFAPSHDISMSRTTLSPSHSSLRHGLNSPSHSQICGPSSTSDISRGVDSERRLSDTSGRRGNTITSLFRRGSSRLKRTYKERFHDTTPEVSNASHESFYKIQTQSSPSPPSVIPQRILMPTGTMKRSQSKFTEHFGDEPLSPPDSRLQSPDIPEEVLESSLERDETFLREPTPSPGVDIKNPNRSHHRSWASDSMDTEADNVPLSQSLASIDSEGSWMSGQFFRRMSQKPSSPVRSNLNSFGRDSVDGPADAPEEVESLDESRRLSNNILGEPEIEPEGTESSASKPAERWHNEVGRRAVVVNPAVRPKSTQAMLRGFPSLSPISAEEDHIMEETTPSELQRIPSAKAEIGYAE
ncbi:hypothetical protein E8E15_008996 [Penicillium rubens]|jgi:hypothetical protein|uniref:Pc21g06130 protein n=2 Tax=Penicillium chrysogenum species complex TaxID=254878 RepID=B6HIV6_PENRW|nr:uncharacterized protein N7525_007086 [Penicillium rubens]KZN88371.1 hypothetical protein EN45_069430 [Penicillium chrysogenum]CAP95510.1 Pc21g06130 [Penicillium rubens Wisconsin 54-1255]KAF3028144.1 hypothetical protein E8E15_008996 [Penicillium rubens]KAJ5049517.1 hypothetical protein NUH16_008036 [Penicillium rubens]KAJ5828833.1 hypothetical protein N7525_007086 [Penicillium rubens]